MQRPPLNFQERALLPTGVVGGLISGGILGYGRILEAVADNKDLQTPLIEGAASTVGVGVLFGGMAAAMVAINRGWGQKEAPVIENPHSTDTSTKAIASYLKTNWKNIAARVVPYVPPLVAAPIGLLFAVAGHDATANVLVWGTLADVSIVLPMSTFLLANRKSNASNNLQ